MPRNKKLDNALKKQDKKKENKPEILSGELGIPISGNKVVEVPNRKGYVFVRIHGNMSELIQAYNASVSPIYDLPILITRRGNAYTVIGRDFDRYQDNWGAAPYLPRHGTQHSFNPELGMGADTTWVYGRQFMPLLGYPSGTNSFGSMNLAIVPDFYEWQGHWQYAQATGTPSFVPYLPTITGSAVMTLLFIQPSDNSLRIVAGSPFSNSITGSAQLAQYIPDVDRSNAIPISAVRLTTGTTGISWDAIYDVRDFYTVGARGFGGIGIQDDGTPVGTGTILNFGNNLAVTMVGGVATIDATAGGGGGGGLGFVAWDEGIFLGTGTILNFVGNNIDASISGSVVRVFVSGSSGGSNAIVEDLSSQINGVSTTFLLSNSVSSNGILLFYNGITQRYGTHFTVSGTYLETLFTPNTGSLIAAEMGQFLTSTPTIPIQDEGTLIGTAQTFNFFGAGVQASISGSGAGIYVPGTEVLIQQISLSNTGTITFTNIPSNPFTQLRLVIRVRTANAATTDQIALRVGNGSPSSAALYSYVIRREGTTQATAQSAVGTSIPEIIIPGNTATVGYYGTVEYIIDGYNEGRWKEISIYGGHTDPAGYRINTGFGTWRSNSIIDTLQIFGIVNSSFISGSYARLYGL